MGTTKNLRFWWMACLVFAVLFAACKHDVRNSAAAVESVSDTVSVKTIAHPLSTRTLTKDGIIILDQPAPPDEYIDSDPNPDKPYVVVEQMPQFPGGDKALIKYLADNLQYPPLARENGIEGRVQVRFVVEKDDSVGAVEILRGVDPSLDKEAIRLVKTLPKFKPGKQNGEAVRVYYTVPVVFRLK